MNNEELRKEMLACPFCNEAGSFGGSPEYFSQCKIKHHFHPELNDKENND